MGFLGMFSSSRKKRQNKRKENEVLQLEINRDGKKSPKLTSQTERQLYIKENCELINASAGQIEEVKAEYQAVTSYLTDMQRIDMIPQEEKENLEDAARKIINLTQERSKFQKKNTAINVKQYRLFEHYELQIPKDLPSIKEAEDYQIIIQKDIKYLDKEKHDLASQQEEIISKQSFLKGIAITVCVIVTMLFAMFAFLSNLSDIDLTIPFLLTVLMGMATALFVFMEARKNSYNNKLVQRKQNRGIMLMNKVKIKSVNNRSYLEYTYNKYMADNYEELKSLWEEYVKAKDEERRYQNNTELLEFYNTELVNELKMFHVTDSEIWIYQPTAILDNKEMVEVRHRLNIRRQKLRERIEIISKQKETALKEISTIMEYNPELEEEVRHFLRHYHIQLEE